MELKSAYIGSARMRMNAAQKSRLVTIFPLRDLRNSELPFDVGEAFDVDRSHDVDHRELARLGGDDDQSGHTLAAEIGVDGHVLLVPAADGDERLPGRAELRLHAVGQPAVVLVVFRELVAAD